MRFSSIELLTANCQPIRSTPFFDSIGSSQHREDYLSVYGPLSLLTLLAFWAGGLIILQWSAGLSVKSTLSGFGEALFFSGSTLVNLVSNAPDNAASRLLMIVEGGIGFGLLGLTVGYLPVLYQSYADRERRIELLDARAGSPPTAGALIANNGTNAKKMEKHLIVWEEWSADVLQHQVSYPMLAYFRSQHSNQSWLAALTAILDFSAVVMLSADGDLRRQAELTFAMARHTVTDLGRLFPTGPEESAADRLPHDAFERLRETVRSSEGPLDAERLGEGELARARSCYEPYAQALGAQFLVSLPGWLPDDRQRDNWRAATWQHSGGSYAVSDPFRQDSR